MVNYLTDSDLDSVFEFVSEHYGNIEEVPVYQDNRVGMEKLFGVLERAKMDAYYPTLLDKATHLLLSINKGHFFSNGNKRLALATTTTFLALNGRDLGQRPKDEYRASLESLFPEHAEYTDFPVFTPTDFATYNLSIIVADSGTYGIEYDVLKERVHAFLSQSVE